MKIQELSDDFADTVKVSEAQQNASQPPAPPMDLLTQAMNTFASTAPQTTNEDGSTGPTLPPAMAAMRNKSTEEILAELNKTPLFMTSLEDNDDLEALKALAYEGTPYEVASGFKERGNESFQEQGYKDAKEFYGKGIQVLLLEVRKRQKGQDGAEKTDKEEIKREVGILELCLVNRAACHLKLKNYRSCVQDCGSVLRINVKNVKAYFRSAEALLKLDKVAEANDACARGLAVDPENKSLQAIANQIIKRNKEVEIRRQKETERENRKRLEQITLRAAIKARGIKTRKTAQPPEMEDAKISLVPDPTDPQSTLCFPAVLLYPLHLESDFVKAFNELESVGDHLSYILPLPWDKQAVYKMNSVECYIETVTGGLIKVGRKASLLKVLTSANVEVVDEVVRIFVVPKASSDEWVKEFKRKKSAEMSGGAAVG